MHISKKNIIMQQVQFIMWSETKIRPILFNPQSSKVFIAVLFTIVGVKFDVRCVAAMLAGVLPIKDVRT
jgi:hypothetical protein